MASNKCFMLLRIRGFFFLISLNLKDDDCGLIINPALVRRVVLNREFVCGFFLLGCVCAIYLHLPFTLNDLSINNILSFILLQISVGILTVGKLGNVPLTFMAGVCEYDN
ncbi:hypothetical protein PHJA_000918000 [Phtheirospermum japonicum]|uniref:Uncharacterized protein n=1 Tax=Phtheirospermum japonicum TaxID=374723 RepID=A0A830BUW1_9LAMI|nr:hypothetical protein PHJA_000918000 [Phtheirospermum japonicum]